MLWDTTHRMCFHYWQLIRVFETSQCHTKADHIRENVSPTYKYVDVCGMAKQECLGRCMMGMNGSMDDSVISACLVYVHVMDLT